MVFNLLFLNQRRFRRAIVILSAAPAASAMTLQFSQRVVIILGGLLATLGMVLASLDLSLPWLYLTMGILQGSTPGTYSKSYKAN